MCENRDIDTHARKRFPYGRFPNKNNPLTSSRRLSQWTSWKYAQTRVTLQKRLFYDSLKFVLKKRWFTHSKTVLGIQKESNSFRHCRFLTGTFNLTQMNGAGFIRHHLPPVACRWRHAHFLLLLHPVSVALHCPRFRFGRLTAADVAAQLWHRVGVVVCDTSCSCLVMPSCKMNFPVIS